MVLLGKDKLNTKALIDSCIRVFIYHIYVLREYNEMKKEIKNPETSVEDTI